MLRFIRMSLAFLMLAFVCLVVWKTARTQSSLRRITHTPEKGISINPSISGDGKVIAFESTEDIAEAGGVEAFRAIRADASVTPTAFVQIGATRAPAPAPSQDGTRIVFASKDNPLGTNDDANSEIFYYDGSKLIQLTNTSPGDISLRSLNGSFQPSISDDGRFVAFSSNLNLTNQNIDGNFEIFISDTTSSSFTQLTNSSGITGSTDARISGDGSTVAYIRDSGTAESPKADLILQNWIGPPEVRVIERESPTLQMTYGRAISDDGRRLVWSEETAENTTQVFLFDGRNNLTRQITNLGARAVDVPLHPTISGDGTRIAFATRRSVAGMGSNSDGSVELYTFDIPSGTFGRVTNVDSAKATADVLSSLSDDGSIIAFNYPRVISGPVTNENFAGNSEIYRATTPVPPASGVLTIRNRASMAHEPSSAKAIAPDSIAVAFGASLSFRTEQPQPLMNGTFPLTVAGTSVTVNGRRAQVLFVSPSEVHFHLPAATEVGSAEVVVTNSDGFPSRTMVNTSATAPGLFSRAGDGLGEGMILDAHTLTVGPFDPTGGDLRLIIFSTGVRNGSTVSAIAGGRALTVESTQRSTGLPGLDEIHVLVPADLRGSGVCDLMVNADGRDSNAVLIEFGGDARRDIVINEFLTDPPEGPSGDANRDGIRDTSQDEFIEFVNTTTRDIDIGGYQILTRSGSSSDVLRHTFSERTIIPSCSAIVIFGGGNLEPNEQTFGGAQILKASSGSLALANSSGVVTFVNSLGQIAGFVSYGGSSGLGANDNQSLTRAPDIIGRFAKHSTVAEGASRFSPGTDVSGSAFKSCAPTIGRIEISPPTETLVIGESAQFTARAFDENNIEVPDVLFQWQSADSRILAIDRNGLGLGVSQGTTQILAVGRGVVSTPASVVVKPPPPVLTSINVLPGSVILAEGETQQITAFALDQFGQRFAGVDIRWATSNLEICTVESINTSDGLATAIVSTRSTGEAEIRASASSGSTTLTSPPASITVEPAAGHLLISEFRTRGPAGAADEFVEIYNPTGSGLFIGGLKLRASNANGTIGDRITITSGTSLGSGCHYLVANSSSAGYSGSIMPDQTYIGALTDDGGIAITGSNGTRIVDAVGMSNGSTYKEGTSLAPLTSNLNRSYERRPGGTFGNGLDSNHNESDFLLNASSDPQNRSSQCHNLNSADLAIRMIDSPDPVILGSDLSYSITVTNNGAGLAQSVVLTDDLPSAVTFVSCESTRDGVCGGTGNSRSVTFPSLASGDSATVTLVAKANGPSGEVPNTASVSSATFDRDPSNNSDSVATVLQAPLPQVSISDVTTNEGDSGKTVASLRISLSAPAPADVFFDVGAFEDSATPGQDYVNRVSTREKIPTGQQDYKFEVEIVGDTLVEPDEFFHVRLTNVSGAVVVDSQATCTIVNDDNANLVISQVYAGGGNLGAPFARDFVELFNRGDAIVDFAVTPYSIQYAGAIANFGSNKLNLTVGAVTPGQYFLVQLAGGPVGSSLPTADAAGAIAMAATAGKVALVAGTESLSGSGCPLTGSIADFVGYGLTVTCFEGSASSPSPSGTNASLRKSGGCTDSGNNADDFFVHAPFPRNTGAPLNDCSSDFVPEISVTDYTEVEGDSGSKMFAFVVKLSAPAIADVVFDISTQDNIATAANNDYEPSTLTRQIIPSGQQTYTFVISVNGDTEVEPDEKFLVHILNVTGATVEDNEAVGTIENDDLPSISINDTSMAEGDAGMTIFKFTVSLSSPSTSLITFDIVTTDDTATTPDLDYVQHSLASQVIPIGEQTYAFNVVVNGDRKIEGDERFLVILGNVSGADLLDGLGVGTIRNDDSAALSISDVAITEGNHGSQLVRFTVSSSLPAPDQGIRFDIATQDKTATGSSGDYVPRGLTNQIISSGHLSHIFEVAINGDLIVEHDESFSVNITNAANATIIDGQGVGTILNDDTASLVISQLYSGGGNAGAKFANDFVEIFNRGSTIVDFSETPHSIQSAGATANFGSNKVDLTDGRIAPGEYFLVRLSGGTNGVPLPTPDATGNIALAASAGKVALVTGTTALSGNGCPLAPPVMDFVAYGATANCFVGTSPAPAPSATTADFRNAGGCTDTDDNSFDFFLHAPAPRNSAAPLNNCTAGPPAFLSLDDVDVMEGDEGSKAMRFTVSLSAVQPSTDVTFDIATQNGTATTTNNDYEARGLKNQIIPAGQLTYTFDVTVNGDQSVEPDETFLLSVSNVAGATVQKSYGVGTITNDDLPSLSISDVTVAEGDTGSKAFDFVITLSAPAPREGVGFHLATQNGTATTPDNDYQAVSLTNRRIESGVQQSTFSVIVNGDQKIEPDETFLVNVSNVSGATLLDAQGLGTIRNDDAAKLSVSDAAIKEGNDGTVNIDFTVSSSLPAPASGITFNIATHDNTASASNGDYLSKSLTAQTILAGQTTYSFTVSVNGDTLVEPDETFLVELSAVSGAEIADDTGQGAILNDDLPSVVISQIYGGGGNSGAVFKNDFIEIFNSGNTIVNLAGWSVQYSSATGATWTTTRLCPSLTCLLLPGQYFLVQEDQGSGGTTELPTPDASGTIALTASAGKVALVSALNNLQGTCPVSSNVFDMVGYGGAAVCFEGLSPAPAPSNALAGVRKGGGCLDTANNAGDFFTHAASPRNSSFPLNPCQGQSTDLAISNATINEADEGFTMAAFTVRLLGETNVSVTVDYATFNSTAVSPSDFEGIERGQLAFLPGETSKTINIRVHGDTLDEPDETFLVVLSNATNAALLDNLGVATITDNDVPPTLTIGDVSLNESNGPTTFSFTVHLSAPALAGGVTFDIATADGTAKDGTPQTEDEDYVAQSLKGVMIPAGLQGYTFNVTVNGDLIDEPNETFFINVNNVSGALVGDGQAMATIQNDDSAVLSIAGVVQAEGNSGTTAFDFIVTSSLPAPPGGISFDVSTIDGSAQDEKTSPGDNDYASVTSASFFIPAGQISVMVPLKVKGDTLVETDETFLLNISNISGASSNNPQAVGTILNDDTASLVISQVYPGGGNSGATYTNDFIEIFNRGTTTVDFGLTPYSLQDAGAAASFGSVSAGNKINIVNGRIAPGQYFLVQGASGGSSGIALPIVDAPGAIAMAATGGKVALVLGLLALPAHSCPGDDAAPPTNPGGNSIVDFVGYGSGANTPNCFEGLGAAAFSTSTAGALDPDTRSVIRVASCVDNNNNSTDFTNPTTAPLARNKVTIPVPCP